MATVTTDLHPLVGDRVIAGNGTTAQEWQSWQGLHHLPSLVVASHFLPNQRVCIVSPHPDDEILGCGGLLQQLAQNSNPIVLVSVTNGTQSHPDSAIFPPTRLDQLRPLETQLALTALGIQNQVTHVALHLQDGQIHLQRQALWDKLAGIIQVGDCLVCPFAYDGHPDHEATGQMVQAFADCYQLACYQVLIWAWHWASPNDVRIPWQQALRLNLTPTQQQLKAQAIHCFKSQLTPDPSTGNAPILSHTTFERMTQPWEVYLHG